MNDFDTKSVPRKRVKEILVEARALMNDGGLHWIKGRLSRKKKVGMCYCSVGAIKAVTSDKTEQAAALEVLALKGVKSYPERSYSFSSSTSRPRIGYRVEGDRAWLPYRSWIESWNDSERRTWQEVDRAFRKAAKALR